MKTVYLTKEYVLILSVLSISLCMMFKYGVFQNVPKITQSRNQSPLNQMYFKYRLNNSRDVLDTSHPILIPDNEELQTMTLEELNNMYWRYVNSIQVLCRRQMRIGSLQDGGKEVCLDDEFVPRQPCLVYSFGSNFQTDFETAIIETYGCEVHTFDPSQPLNGSVLPKGIHFHMYGLSSSDHANPKKWQMRTLDSIISELGHSKRTLDILKMDIEESEWYALPQILMSGVFRNVKQLQIETHFIGDETAKMNALIVLRLLYEHGLYIFMRDRNLNCSPKDKPLYTFCNEISLINMQWVSRINR